MKERMKKLRTFLTFDTPLEMNHINMSFATIHSQYQHQIPGWGHTSTRQKLIANYWFADVLAHFAAMISLPVLLLWIVTRHFNAGDLVVVFIVSLFYFTVMLVANYWPGFVSQFLPKLEAVVSICQNEQQQKMIRQLQQELIAQQEVIKKCRQAQLSNFALTLIYYAFTKAAGNNSLESNDNTANLLLKLYG